jgi:hypothetical protein
MRVSKLGSSNVILHGLRYYGTATLIRRVIQSLDVAKLVNIMEFFEPIKLRGYLFEVLNGYGHIQNTS